MHFVVSCYIFFGNFYLHIKSSGILHVLVSSWDETKSIAVFCKPAGQDETTSSTTYKCLSSSSCKLVFPYKFLSKLVGIKYFYIQPCGICLCKSIFQANFDCRFVNDNYCVEELSVSVSNTLFSNFSLA